MEKQIKRSVNWEQDEKDLLSNLVLENLDIIENPKIDTNTNKKKKEAWHAIHALFNNVSKNSRTFDQIQNQWRKMKSLAKSKHSAYVRQTKMTVGGPPPEQLNSVEEELVWRLPKHFTVDTNIYDSNSSVIEEPVPKINTSHVSEESLNSDEAKKPKVLKTKRKVDWNSQFENSKRIKLLDISIRQKQLEIKIMEDNHIMQKRKNELIETQLKEEHSLKVEILKLEIEKLKKRGYFSICL